MTLPACHTCIWGVPPILLCRSSQALSSWMGSVVAQLLSGISRDVRLCSSLALAGPLKDIQRLVPKPLLCCLGCVLRVIVLLEGEPSPQSEVLSALGQIPFIFHSILTSLSVPATEKHPPQHDAAFKLHRRDGSRFPPDFTLVTQAKEFNLGFISPSGLSCAFY